MSRITTPGHTYCTIVFVDREQRSRVLGAVYIECKTDRLGDPEYRKHTMEIQRKHRGPSERSCFTIMLEGDYSQAQAAMALHAGVVPLGTLE